MTPSGRGNNLSAGREKEMTWRFRLPPLGWGRGDQPGRRETRRVDGLFVDDQVNVPTRIAVGSGRQHMHLGEVDRVGTASGEPVRPV
jgi:hypothetical protein